MFKLVQNLTGQTVGWQECSTFCEFYWKGNFNNFCYMHVQLKVHFSLVVFLRAGCQRQCDKEVHITQAICAPSDTSRTPQKKCWFSVDNSWPSGNLLSPLGVVTQCSSDCPWDSKTLFRKVWGVKKKVGNLLMEEWIIGMNPEFSI